MKLAGCVLLALLVSCANTSPHATILDPGIVDRDQTLAVVPMALSPELASLAGEAEVLNQALVARLRSAGYEVIEPASLAEGAPLEVEAVAAAVEAATGRDVDVLVFPALEVREASFSGATARWDGTWQAMEQHVRRLSRSTADRRILQTHYSGSIPALSLAVRMATLDGDPAYEGFGGLHVMMTRTGPDFDEVPHAELLAEEDRNLTAVDLALAPLLP